MNQSDIMTNMIPSSLSMVEKLPIAMRTEFWVDFINVIEEELLLFTEKISEKRDNYNINMMGYERMLEISDILNMPLDSSANSDLEFTRSEIKAIPFKYKWKGTVKFYNSLFLALNTEGQVFLYYWTGSDLIRNSKNLLLNINSDYTLPIQHDSEANFTGVIAEELRLDTGWNLDDTIIKNLDTILIKQNTKHLGFEITLKEILQTLVDDGIYSRHLMIPEYYSYLGTNIDKFRKVIDVPHIGSQLTAIADISEKFDSFSNPGEDWLNYCEDFNNSLGGFTVVGGSLTIDDYFCSISKSSGLCYIEKTDIDPIALSSNILSIKLRSKSGNISNINIYTIIDSVETSIKNYTQTFNTYHIYEMTLPSTGTLTGLKIELPNQYEFGDLEIDYIQIFKTEPYTTTNFIKAIGKSSNSGLLISDIDSIDIGIGSHHNLKREINAGGILPASLSYKVANIKIHNDEKYSNTDFIGGCVAYPGNLINDLIIATGDGSETDFTYILPFAPIKPLNVKISYKNLTTIFEFQDDGLGKFKSENGTGIINYETGELSISTIGIYTVEDDLGAQGLSVYNYNTLISQIPMVEGSIIIEYRLGGTLYRAKDNGMGNISGQGIISGAVNYVTGDVDITFIGPTQETPKIYFEYEVNKRPDNGSEIKIEYYFTTQKLEITEMGIKDSSSNLLGYATFYPVKFDNFATHCSFGFILKKSIF